ncbi:MAG: hypothetical protein JWQ01_1535 [Massilia sp.]|nr:hypothetical protein [Massilia sp.]
MNKAFSIAGRVCVPVVLLAAMALSVSANDRDDRDHRDGPDGRYADSLIEQGRRIVPPGVRLNLTDKNRSMVWLGSYIVNTSGCIDCHSHPTYLPGGDPFMGQQEVINSAQYLSGGRQFGPITAANITPNAAGLPAGLTLHQFIQTLRTGHNPNDPPGEILQVMPWPAFGKKTDTDLAAIYEYLKAIPSLPDNPNPGP